MTRRYLIESLSIIGATLLMAQSPYAFAQKAVTEADPTVREVNAGDTVHASRIPDRIYLRDPNDPDDVIWAHIPLYRTLLSAAPPVHASTQLRFEPKEAQHLYFQLARTAERFYVRLRWQDPNENRKTNVDAFCDGAAIQMALNGADTSYMMGSSPEKPVNIWYWRADQEQVEDLAAGGYGSTTLLPDQAVTGKAAYHAEQNDRDNEWHVVMSRQFDSPGKYQVGLQKGTIPVAFAVWQGAEGQRDGNKRVSHSWILVDVRPAPPSPPPQARPSAPAKPPAATSKPPAKPDKSKPAGPGVKSKDVPKAGQFY
jgi:DMSO reductase family type II enzyme heme b subunit